MQEKPGILHVRRIARMVYIWKEFLEGLLLRGAPLSRNSSKGSDYLDEPPYIPLFGPDILWAGKNPHARSEEKKTRNNIHRNNTFPYVEILIREVAIYKGRKHATGNGYSFDFWQSIASVKTGEMGVCTRLIRVQ